MAAIARGQITIGVVKDGSDAYSVLLDHENHSVACDSSGTPLTGETGAGGKAVFTLKAFKGSKALSLRYSTSAPAAGMCCWSILSSVSVTCSCTNNDTVTVDALSADSGKITVRCYLENTNVYVDRIITLTKQKQGETGKDGQGAMLRPRGVWKANTVYCKNTQYIDTVIYDGNNYVAIVGHTSGSSFDATKWSSFNEFINVATQVLLAGKGTIDVLGAGELFVGDLNRTKGWSMTQGRIKHSVTGLELTSDGQLQMDEGDLLLSGKSVSVIARNSIEIGGRNYLPNSAFLNNYNGWGISGAKCFTGTKDGMNCLGFNNTGFWRDGSLASSPVITGLNAKELVLSFLYYSVSGFILVDIDGDYDEYIEVNVSKYSWQKVEIPIKSDTVINALDFKLYGTDTVKADGWCTRFKLEVGNKATDWSPAPDDITDAIGNLSSELSLVPGKITAAVNGLQVGGRNYILRDIQENPIPIILWKENIPGSIQEIASMPKYMYIIAKTSSGVNVNLEDTCSPLNGLIGKTVTISFYLSITNKTTGTFNVYVDKGDSEHLIKTVSSSLNYQRYSFKVNNFQKGHLVFADLTPGAIYNLMDFQLETGDIMTDYKEDPLETNAAINNLSSRIGLIPGQI